MGVSNTKLEDPLTLPLLITDLHEIEKQINTIPNKKNQNKKILKNKLSQYVNITTIIKFISNKI